MKRVKEIIIISILVVSIVGINGQDLLSDDDKKVSLEITTNPPLVTVYSEDTATERLRIPKLKIRPFNRTASESSDKLTNEEIEKKINEAVEVVTKIETIEEIRIVTERPRLSKKLIHKRKKAKKEQVEKHENEMTENESDSPTLTTSTTTTTTTTTTDKPKQVVEENDVDEPEPPLIGIRGISSKEVNDNDSESESEEEPEEPEDPEPTPHPARPKIRPILTRKPTATRRSFKLLTPNVTPETKLEDATQAPADGQSTTRKKFVRRRYKKVDYKNGTIEKFYVGPSVEVDPVIRQAKLNAATTEAPDLPTPIIHGRTTKRGRLTPKRLVGRTTSVRPKTAVINGGKVDGDVKKPLSRRLIYKRPVLKNFDLNKPKTETEQKENNTQSSSVQPEQNNEEIVEVTTEDEGFVKEKPSENELNYQRRPYLQKNETAQPITERVQNDENLEEENYLEKVKVNQRRPVLKNITPKENTQSDNEEDSLQTTKIPQRRLVLKKRVQKNNEEETTDNDDEENVVKDEPPKQTFQRRPIQRSKDENTTEEKTTNEDEVKTQQPPRRVFQKRPVQQASKNENTNVEETSTKKDESLKESLQDKNSNAQKTQPPPRNGIQRRPLQNKYEQTKTKNTVEEETSTSKSDSHKEINNENDDEELVQTTTRRNLFRKPVQKDIEAVTPKKEENTNSDEKENVEEESDRDVDEVTKLPRRRVLLKRPIQKTQTDDDGIKVNSETASVQPEVVDSSDESVTKKEPSLHRTLQRRPVQKNFETPRKKENNAVVDDTETSTPEQESVELTTEIENKEVTKPPPRRVLLRRPIYKTPEDKSTAEDETESVEGKTDGGNTRAPPKRLLQRRPVQNKLETSTTKVENSVESKSDENHEDEYDNKTKFTQTSQNNERRPGFVKFEPTKQRKFIIRLKAIRERPTTTTETPTTEFVSTDEESTETDLSSTEPTSFSNESSSLNVEISELPSSTVSSKSVENLKETKNNESSVNEVKVTSEKEEEEKATKKPLDVDSENQVSSKPINRFDTISRAPFPIRRRTNTSRATSRPLNERFHRPRPLQENAQDDEEENEVQRAPTSRYRLQSRRRPQEPQVEETEKTDEEKDNELALTGKPNPSQKVSTARNGSRLQSRHEENTKQLFNNQNNKVNGEAEEVKKSSANSELLRRRSGSRRTQPTVVSRFNSRTESTSNVPEEKVEKTTNVVLNQQNTEIDNEKEIVKLSSTTSKSITEGNEVSLESSTTLKSTTDENELPHTTSSTLKAITEEAQSTSTTLHPTTEKATSFRPQPSTFEKFSTNVRTTKPTLSTTTFVPRRRGPSTTSSTFATNIDAFNQLVKQKHQEVIQSVVSGLRGRQFVSTLPTTVLPSRVSTTSSSTTFKPTTTFSSSPVNRILESQTSTPLVKFFIQDDSYYSLNPSRTFVPQVPFLSDAFRQILTDPPSRVVQQLPIDSETNISDELTVKIDNSNSASRFRVTAATQPPVYSSTVGLRQTPSVYTTTTLTSTPGFPHSFESSQSTDIPLSSSVGVSQNAFPTPTHRFQSFSSTTRTIPTKTTTHFRTQQPRYPSVVPSVNRQSFSNQIQTETVDLSPRIGPNRGRGGKRFNQNELKWNSEIWSLQGEDQGYYNFIKY